MTPALGRVSGGLLALLAGFIALSWEIVWYRAYAVALMGRPQAFAVVLGGYLIGLGAATPGWCGSPGSPTPPTRGRLPPPDGAHLRRKSRGCADNWPGHWRVPACAGSSSCRCSPGG